MLSKYPIRSDYFDIPDTEEVVKETNILYEANKLALEQTEAIEVDTEKVKEERFRIPGYRGGEIEVRMYSPADAKNGEELPCIFNFHGGAFVGEWLPNQKLYCLYFAEHLHCRVVFVRYRVALDHPFPVPVEDCYEAMLWAVGKYDVLGIDKKKLIVFGDSAGGALAAAVCLMARDRKGPRISYQMLIYPVTDCRCSTESAVKYTDVPCFNASGNRWMWELYLKNGNRGMVQYASPMLAEDFSKLPPAYVETAEFDCLHDEGVAYAKRLQEAGVLVTLNETKGTFHGFDTFPDREYSKYMLAYRADVLKKILKNR